MGRTDDTDFHAARRYQCMEESGNASHGGSTRTRNRVVAIVGGLGVVAILIALGYVFSTSSGAQQVATNARSLHLANAAAGSAAVARVSIAQAVVFSIDHDLGVASTEARDVAITEADTTLEQTRNWVGPLTDDPASRALGSDLEDFTSVGDQVLGLLLAGDSLSAEQLRRETLEPTYAELAVILEERQSDIIQDIRATEMFAGTVGWITRLLATLLIPAVAIVLYFLVVRRQFREAELKLDTRLRAERDIGLAKDEFIAGISHELRTPLTSIYGFSEYLLEQEMLDPAETSELLGLINRDSAELSRMVDDLLTAARLESDALSFSYEYVDLREETEAAIDAMIRSGAEVTVSGTLTVWADPVRVRQIVRNLVSNAIKHGGSSIGVYIEETPDFAVLTVSDDGDSLAPDMELRLFERFVHDGDEVLLTGSVGLGLSIARSLAQTMGGEIRFVRAGGWTNFEVSLPRVSADPGHTPTASDISSAAGMVGANPVLVET